MNEGWIKLFRSLLDWEWYSNPNTRMVFIHCLLKANFEDKDWHGLLIKRGQFVTGRFTLSNEICISQQKIRTSLNNLKSTGEITIKSYNKFSVITVLNYEKYQETTSSLTNNQPAINQQLTTTKEIKKERIKENNNISEKKKKHVYKDGEVTDLMCADIAKKKLVSLNEVLKTRQMMIDWCKSTGTTYADYKMTIMVWIQRQLDKGQIRKVQIVKNEVPVMEKMSPEKIAENTRKMAEIREKVVKKLVVDNKLSQS